MRWNQFDSDPVRASALGDILLAAAFADGPISDAKLAVVYGQVAKTLGASELPPEVVSHLRRFDARRVDAAHTVHSLELGSVRDRVALVKTVVQVIGSDGNMSRGGRAFALRLAQLLGLSWAHALDLVGLPARPVTGPRPRPITRPF